MLYKLLQHSDYQQKLFFSMVLFSYDVATITWPVSMFISAASAVSDAKQLNTSCWTAHLYIFTNQNKSSDNESSSIAKCVLSVSKFTLFRPSCAEQTIHLKMNAVMALCHFCELHGPSILFCTQAFHADDPQDVLDGKVKKMSYYPWNRSRSSSTGSASSHGGIGKNPKTELCEACRSFQPGQPGLISTDHEAHISYVSMQYPDQPLLFSIVRQACVRSLSCEVCQGREGPVFFGDDDQGYVFSYTFFVKDSKARGFQRFYSIIVVMMDRIYLLNSWPFLVKNVRALIKELQTKGAKVYEQEQPQKSLRMNQEFFNNDQFFRRRGGSTYRSLIDLTDDKNLFRYIHMTLTWILKTGGSRIVEKVLQGPPKEETVVDLDKVKETEDGFIMVDTKVKEVEETESPPNEELLQHVPIELANPLVVEEPCNDNGPVFTSLRDLRNVLGSLNFHDLAHHVLIGNQIIVRSQHFNTINSLLDILKSILPNGCCKVVSFSENYQPSWTCNFLGLPPFTGLPPHVIENEQYILLDILSPDMCPTNSNRLCVSKDSPFHGYGINMTSSRPLPDKGPTILAKIESILDSTHFTPEVVRTYLICLQEEWMNKVKVVYKFSRSGTGSEEEMERLLKIMKTEESDKQLLKFWQTGLSRQYRSHLLTSNIATHS
ncbi:folliculin-like [Anneissia japonica]|uniref:folliculin-like n=1 Tax=Anneissia japonica TaxID=1529436 RepID=UPI001425632F|nr:folliculin-like [Anneissia japonica]